MLNHIEEDNTFNGLNTQSLRGLAGTFENCTFNNCELAGAHLTGIIFMDCTFNHCDLTGASFADVGLQNVWFKHSRLTSANFSKSRDFLFGVNFQDCLLDNASFYLKKNKGAIFSDCSITEADFTDCDLTDAKFSNCNLHRAMFSRTVLKNADLRSSYNYIIDPDDNQVKKARFSVHGLAGLLVKYDIRVEG